MLSRTLIASGVISLLVGCGGGGGSDSTLTTTSLPSSNASPNGQANAATGGTPSPAAFNNANPNSSVANRPTTPPPTTPPVVTPPVTEPPPVVTPPVVVTPPPVVEPPVVVNPPPPVVTPPVVTELKAPTNRSMFDQPDDSDLPQIHLVYVVPNGGVDKAFDLTQTIANTTGSWNNWLATQTDGRKLRIDTVNKDTIDVTYIQLNVTDSYLESFGWRKRDQIEIELNKMLPLKSNKTYYVYYEGGNARTCADAPHPPELAGRVAVMYLQGAFPGYPTCISYNSFAASPTAAPGYLDFMAIHELVHTLGFVDFDAPNENFNGHVDNDPRDLMYAGDKPWTPSILDVTKTNYYNPNGLPTGIANFANSSYLMPKQ